MKEPLRLRHYFTHYQSLGGVQSIIRAHLRLDPTANLPSTLLAFFDPAGAMESTDDPLHKQVTGLGITGRHSIRQVRTLFQQHEQNESFDIPIYHDLWGLGFLGQFDGSPLRRVGAVHSQWPHLDYELSQLTGSLDGVFCDSQRIADYVIEQLPELDETRVRHLPVPAQVAPEAFFVPRKPLHDRRVVLGFVGRLDFAQKRVDRFPALLERLQKAGLDCELQFLGSGDASQSLPGKFASDAPVTFFGRRSGDEYWKIMSQWDFVVYTSDHEGSPLAMIESLSVGNLPIFPKIKSGGDLVVEKIDPGLLYEPENWDAIAGILCGYIKRSEAAIQEARQRCRDTSQAHSASAYHAKFLEFLETILDLPRISRSFSPNRPFHLTDHLPLAALTRWFPKAFYHANPVTPAGDPHQS